MTSIEMTTRIAAPIDLCFTLALDVEIELRAASDQSIKAVAGVTSGVMRGGDTVTWKAKHFGLWLSHTSIISGYDPPTYFQDSMVRGVFRSFAHDHFFTRIDAQTTVMRDALTFSMPILLLGPITEVLIVKRQLSELLLRRNRLIQQAAEAACGRS